ncbi:protein kinase, partial [Myxococcota bacterium]|nr:protein kinase [Myxococcota bacterium]
MEWPEHAAEPAGAAPAVERDRFGPFRLLERLGRGGMGVVHRAEHDGTGELVALKTVLRIAGHDLAGIRREIRALESLEHPGVVRIRAQGIADGVPFYAMDLLEGETLRDHLRAAFSRRGIDPGAASETRITSAETLGPEAPAAPSVRGSAAWCAPAPDVTGRLLLIVRRLCSALAYLHGRGIVHRDLKPENVFVRPDGAPVIVDFGIASRTAGGAGREVLDLTSRRAGSLTYMAPEQIRGDVVDARADLYALGCILYECLTGRPPFEGVDARAVAEGHLRGAPLAPSARGVDVSPELERLVLGLLCKAPDERPGFAADVDAALDAAGVSDPAPRAVPRPAAYTYRPPLVGRDALARELAERVESLAAGRGGLVLLGGESGAGKTRLLMEAVGLAEQRRLLVTGGECAALSGALPAPALEPLRGLLTTIGDHCRARGERERRLILGDRAARIATVDPSFRDLVPSEEDAAPAPTRERLIAALSDTLRAFAATTPLLLAIDDAQWIDALSLDVVGALVRADLAAHPILIIATCRWGEAPAGIVELAGATDVLRLDVARLDRTALEAIVAGMLAVPRPPPSLLELLDGVWEGNPFFVAEYLRAAIVSGVLRRDAAARWHLDEDGASFAALERRLPLPEALSRLIRGHLDALSGDGRALVELGSVAGREVDAELLVSASGLPE